MISERNVALAIHDKFLLKMFGVFCEAGGYKSFSCISQEELEEKAADPAYKRYIMDANFLKHGLEIEPARRVRDIILKRPDKNLVRQMVISGNEDVIETVRAEGFDDRASGFYAEFKPVMLAVIKDFLKVE